MRGRQFYLALLSSLLLFVGVADAGRPAAAAPAPLVRAVMFWSDSCPHCHFVLDEVLPPLQERYGQQLTVHLIQLRTQADFQQFQEIVAASGLSPASTGVPLLLIGDAVLVGSRQIPAELPGLIEYHLARGGVDYPPLPGLAPLLPGAAAGPAVEAVSTPVPAPARDGFGAAIAVLVGLVLALLYTGLRLFDARSGEGPRLPLPRLERAVPLLAAAGLLVAGYLAYVETQGIPAVCGPVGDCNAVQTSSYAYLLGVPIGVLGVAGYLAVLGVWLWARHHSQGRRGPLLLVGVAAVGSFFSAYLTYLEPFVIGAVCAWCLTSAVIMMLLLLATVEPAAQRLAPVRAKRDRRVR